MLAPESRLWRDDRTRLGQELTYGEVRFDLAETVRSPPTAERTLTRFSSVQVCNVRVNSSTALTLRSLRWI
jgi:hypothetical protein